MCDEMSYVMNEPSTECDIGMQQNKHLNFCKRQVVSLPQTVKSYNQLRYSKFRLTPQRATYSNRNNSRSHKLKTSAIKIETMSSESLRKALFGVAINKKSEKVQQKIQQQVNLTLKEWETILHGYVNITAQLSTLTKLAEQQEHIACVRKTLKECTDLAKAGTDTFEKIWRLVELSLPISTMDHNWMTSILKHDKLLVEIKESLSSLLLFSSNREVIEVVQKMMLQIAEVQEKINVVSTKVRETVGEVFQIRSDQFDELDKAFEVDDDNEEDVYAEERDD